MVTPLNMWIGRVTVMLCCTCSTLVTGQESEKAGPSKPVQKFPIPVWHPDARWQFDEHDFEHDNNLVAVDLSGPRHEVMWGGHYKYPALAAGFNGSGRCVFMGYDSERDRFHEVTSGAEGCLDGPFSRARMSVSDYHGGHERAYSPDKRYFFWLDDFYSQRVRVLDFAEQKALSLSEKGVAVACGESGKVYLVQGINPPTAVVVLTPGPEFKVSKTVKVQGSQRAHHLGTSVAIDEKHERLYATTYRGEQWFVWYWDLKDGSFHGVLPVEKDKAKARAANTAGSFVGTNVYNHGEIAWGPDDPDKRFLYMTRVDTYALFRLDLENKIIAVFNLKQGKFMDEGGAEGNTIYAQTPYWFEDGSFLGGIPWYVEAPHHRFFKRVK